MSMAFRVERINNNWILIRKIMRVKKARDLPKEYLESKPCLFGWNDGRGITIIDDDEFGMTLRERDIFPEIDWNEYVELIKRAGDNLHEVTERLPKKERGNVWTVVI